MNCSELIVGNSYFFHNHHVSSRPNIGSVFRGKLVAIQEQDWIECKDAIGNSHWLNRFAVYDLNPIFSQNPNWEKEAIPF